MKRDGGGGWVKKGQFQRDVIIEQSLKRFYLIVVNEDSLDKGVPL